MSIEEIQIGHVYAAAFGKNTVNVRIEKAEAEGWSGTNVANGNPIKIKHAKSLRYEIVEAEAEKKTLAKKGYAPSKAEKKSKSKKEAKPKKLSAIDAAAQVLGDAKESMTCQELIEQMATKGLWSSPNGQTPHATLYSAILREITTKGKESRFTKTERGKFACKA